MKLQPILEHRLSAVPRIRRRKAGEVRLVPSSPSQVQGECDLQKAGERENSIQPPPVPSTLFLRAA